MLIPHKFLSIFETLAKQGKTKQATELIIAIIKFDMTGEEPTISDDGVAFVWESVIRPQLEENIQKYKEVSKARTDAVNNRYKQINTKVTNEYKSKQSENLNTFVTDYDDDVDVDIDINKKEEVEEEKTPQKYQPILEAWNNLPVTNIRIISGKRLQMLKSRIKQYSFDDVLKAIQTIHNSPFLLGDNKRKWQITFDWFILPNNFPKVLEGNYLPKEEPAPAENKFDKVIADNQNKQGEDILFMDIVRAYKDAKANGETRTLQEYAEEYRQRKRGELNGVGNTKGVV